MNFGEAMTAWATSEPSVLALVLIGSQVRASDDAVWRADAQSDWDFQIVTTRPQMFADGQWTTGIPDVKMLAYAARSTRVGRVPKANSIFDRTEADFVVIPAKSLRLARWAVRLGLHQRSAGLRRSLQDLAIVIRPGFRVLKGAAMWEGFYRRVVAEVPDPRLSDGEARSLADAFVCDSLWVRRKIERGELLAAQRVLHRELAETNFRLLHEVRLRLGERSFPEARRIERIVDGAQLASMTVSSRPNATELSAALDASAATLRRQMRDLAGDAWRWPKQLPGGDR